MAVIHVYADESGTPPLADNDEVFLGAAFLVIGEPPTGLPIDRRSTPEATARLLQEIGAEPCCFFVRPTAGYEARLRPKHAALDLLARIRVLAYGGDNAVSTPRNWVWTQLMAVTAGSTLATALTRVARAGAERGELLLAPERIHICLHRKAVGRPIRSVQRQVLTTLGETVGDLSRAMAPSIPDPQTRSNFLFWAQNFRIDPGAITVGWSHDRVRDPHTGAPNPHAGALWLAHSLAYAFQQELRKVNPKQGFIQHIRDQGFTHGVSIDCTARLLRGLSRRNLENWSRRTGLPIPAGTPME